MKRRRPDAAEVQSVMDLLYGPSEGCDDMEPLLSAAAAAGALDLTADDSDDDSLDNCDDGVEDVIDLTSDHSDHYIADAATLAKNRSTANCRSSENKDSKNVFNPKCIWREIYPEPTDIASEDDLARFVYDLGNLTLSPQMFRALLKADDLRMIEEDFCQKNRVWANKTANPIKVITLCQDPSFPLQDRGNTDTYPELPELPVVQYASRRGFIVKCSRMWTADKEKIEKYLEDGSELLGYQWAKTKKWSQPYALIRSYKIANPSTSAKGYYRVSLSDESASSHHTCEAVGVLVRATFDCDRPSQEHELHHIGQNKHDDSLKNTEWVTKSENKDRHHRDPEKRDSSVETLSLPVDKQMREKEHVRWFRHPVQQHLEVDEGGTHVYDTKKGEFVKMRQRTNKKSGYVDVTLKVPGCRRFLSRVALECFLQRSLKKGEEADHRNRDRKDNSKGNLRPLFRLGNANNKQSKYICPFSKVQGVHLKFKKNGQPMCFVAKVQMYAPEGPTTSSQIERRFSTGITEEEYEEALKAAIAWRNRHTLKDGML